MRMRFSCASISASGNAVMSMSVLGATIPHFIRSMTVVPPAMQRASLFSASMRSASPVLPGRNSSNACTLHLSDGGEDVRVCSATAEIAAHRLANLIVGLRVTLGDQSNCRDDLTRRAKAALKRVVLDERALYRVQRAIQSDAFYCRDLVIAMHQRERQARQHAATVDEHGARTALARIAAFLCSGQAYALAKRIQQW